MIPQVFRTDIDEAEFRQHARDNYDPTVDDDPNYPFANFGIYHPAWVHEAAAMRYEKWQEWQELKEEMNEEAT